jgi:DNA invertase Pin-like site-specific DNA recombinase
MSEPFDTSTPVGEFMLDVMAGMARLERKNIIQRSVDGKLRKVRQGFSIGASYKSASHQAAFGYKCSTSWSQLLSRT